MMILVQKASFALVFFIVIVVVSAVFRITNMELIEFKGDEAVNLFLASRPLFGHSFPPGGTVSSIGILNPPLINYILFPLTLLSLNPKTISLFIGLINSFAIGLLFLLLQRYYGLLCSAIAAILFALSPWAILYSRKIWPQDFLLLFLLPWLYSIHKLVLEKRKSYWILYITSSLLLIQLHLPSFFIIILMTIFLIKRKANLSLRSILLGVILGSLPFLPFLGYQITNNCPDCATLLTVRQKASTTYDIITFLRPLQIMSQGNFSFIMGSDFVTFANDYPFIYTIRRVFYIEYLLLPVGMFFFWKRWKKLRFLVYITLLLPVLYFFLRIVPHMHYYIVLAPLLFFFSGYALAIMLVHRHFFVKAPGVVLILFLVATSIGFNKAFSDLLNKQKSLSGDYGIIFSVTEQTAKKNLEKYSNIKEFDEILLANYVPRSFVHANAPGAKMLFLRQQTEKNLQALEQRLREVPDDARIQLELIAYFTKPPVTADTLKMLEEKTITIPGYRLVVEEVNQVYHQQTK